MTKLRFSVPDNFKPHAPTRKESFAQDSDDNGIKYWIYTDNDKIVDYINATPEQVIFWARHHVPERNKFAEIIFSYKPEDLKLAVDRAAYLSIVCRAMIDSRNSLFGTSKITALNQEEGSPSPEETEKRVSKKSG